MGKKGGSRHLKRYPAPVAYPIERKTHKFTIRPMPGAHPKDESIPLGIVVREILGHAKRYREVKTIIARKKILIDRRPIRYHQFTVGLMDIIEIPDTGERYRLIPYHGRRKYRLQPITEDETTWKLCQIKNKKIIKGGKLSFGLHDGRTIVINPNDENPEKISANISSNEIRPMDTVKISIPDQKILEHYPFQENNYAIIAKGSNIGIHGTIIHIERRIGKNKSLVVLHTKEGDEIRTSIENIFVIGRAEPVIRIDAEESVA